MNNRPLGMPVGSVRAIIAIIVVVSCMIYFLRFDKFPTELVGMLGIVIGFYFSSRQSEVANENADNMVRAINAAVEADRSLIDRYAAKTTEQQIFNEMRDSEISKVLGTPITEKEIVDNLKKNPIKDIPAVDSQQINDIPTTMKTDEIRKKDLSPEQQKAVATFEGNQPGKLDIK